MSQLKAIELLRASPASHLDSDLMGGVPAGGAQLELCQRLALLVLFTLKLTS